MKFQDYPECCGTCCWFTGEDTDGYGWCVNKNDYLSNIQRCSDEPCSDYASRQQQRDYTAILIRANRYRRDQHVPSIYRMPNPTDLGKAIDFAVNFIKNFGEL